MQDVTLALVIFILAFLCESMVEYVFGTPVELRLGPLAKLLALRYVALAVGILAALNWSVDFFGGYLGLTARIPYSGEIATGLVIGRGSSYVHELFKRLTGTDIPVPGR